MRLTDWLRFGLCSKVLHRKCEGTLLSLLSESYHEVLRRFGAVVAYSMLLTGVNEGGRSRTQSCRFADDGQVDLALREEKQFFMHVMMRRVRLASRCERRLVDLNMRAIVGDSFQDRPRDVCAILVYRKLIERRSERRDRLVCAPGRRSKSERSKAQWQRLK
jgi:hypothetical protein